MIRHSGELPKRSPHMAWLSAIYDAKKDGNTEPILELLKAGVWPPSKGAQEAASQLLRDLEHQPKKAAHHREGWKHQLMARIAMARALKRGYKKHPELRRMKGVSINQRVADSLNNIRKAGAEIPPATANTVEKDTKGVKGRD